MRNPRPVAAQLQGTLWPAPSMKALLRETKKIGEIHKWCNIKFYLNLTLDAESFCPVLALLNVLLCCWDNIFEKVLDLFITIAQVQFNRI